MKQNYVQKEKNGTNETLLYKIKINKIKHRLYRAYNLFLYHSQGIVRRDGESKSRWTKEHFNGETRCVSTAVKQSWYKTRFRITTFTIHLPNYVSRSARPHLRPTNRERLDSLVRFSLSHFSKQS